MLFKSLEIISSKIASPEFPEISQVINTNKLESKAHKRKVNLIGPFERYQLSFIKLLQYNLMKMREIPGKINSVFIIYHALSIISSVSIALIILQVI